MRLDTKPFSDFPTTAGAAPQQFVVVHRPRHRRRSLPQQPSSTSSRAAATGRMMMDCLASRPTSAPAAATAGVEQSVRPS